MEWKGEKSPLLSAHAGQKQKLWNDQIKENRSRLPILKMRRFSYLLQLRLSLPPEMGEIAQTFISKIDGVRFVSMTFSYKNTPSLWKNAFSPVETSPPSSSVFRMWAMRPFPPPLRRTQKHFLTRYTVKNEISNLYILLESALKMQEMPFQTPKL